MSQLDDDLYGDLYGAEDEFAVPLEPEPFTQTEEVKISAKEEPLKPVPQQTTQTKAATPTPETKYTTPPAPSTQSVSAAPTASTATAASANVSAPAPAPIPTHIASPTSYSESTNRAIPPVSNGSAYSTQIAQQYSTQAYEHNNSGLDHQDYNQYMQRNEIQQVDTTGERSRINVLDRSVRPSEMKDEG
ncbi:hypothetical protein Clacol_002500 [Clathrus columnatus]|uniref:Uncharacterized protein n=1 Tax=Clathrus columnatus TaxID=1419009 RepID=A0AAV5A6C3_9AGAM|nr:hypothetical protein Clacol_002500 [Clathrus columnatus]